MYKLKLLLYVATRAIMHKLKLFFYSMDRTISIVFTVFTWFMLGVMIHNFGKTTFLGDLIPMIIFSSCLTFGTFILPKIKVRRLLKSASKLEKTHSMK